MANVDTLLNSNAIVAAGRNVQIRELSWVIDFADVTLGATDVLRLALLPKGTMVYGAFLHQISAGVDATNQVTLSIGGVTTTAVLDADDAAGVIEAVADVSGGAPFVLTADGYVSLTSGTAARTTGKVRVVAYVTYNNYLSEPGLLTRDQLA